MTAALLDVNVLVALLDAEHVAHPVAVQWYREHAADGWATCPITENGVLRVLSGPRYSSPVPFRTARDLLARAASAPSHRFWPCDVSLLDDAVLEPGRIHGTKQITDASLLALAAAHDGRLVTLDRSVVRSAVRGAAPDRLVVLG